MLNLSNLRCSFAALSLLALASCGSPSSQAVARPDPASAVAPNACRVYIARTGAVGSLGTVTIFEDDVEIGRIQENEFVCWDRRATRGTCHLVYHGVEPKDVESFFELPSEGGATAWYQVSIDRAYRKPQVERLDEKAGRQLVAQCKPAPQE